jgi:L-ascorbate metabolism protein UlaG (beta-lactamase superfamily)
MARMFFAWASMFVFVLAGCEGQKGSPVDEEKPIQEEEGKPREEEKPKPKVSITWIGHACFAIRSSEGFVIVTDPYSNIGYKNPNQYPDIVANAITVSHEHSDHNAVGFVNQVPGGAKVIRGSGEHLVDGIRIKGIGTYHDEVQGAQRGPNTVFVMDVDGIRICHLGDLGHLLSAAQLSEIGVVDVLMIPVGGVYTIDAAKATMVLEQIRPRIAIPMHYKTPSLSFSLDPVDKFLSGKEGVERPGTDTITLTPGELPDPVKIIVLDYRR